MNRTVKVFLLALATVFTVNGAVFAAPRSNSQSQVENLEINIEKLDNQIESVLHNLEDNKKQIAKTGNDIKTAEKEIKTAEDNIKKQQGIFNSRMRAMYINGSSGYINLVLDSEGIGDFISRVDMMKRVISFDKKVVEDYKVKQSDIKNKKDKLTVENKRLVSLKSDNEKKLSKLNEDKEKQKALVAQARQQQRLLASADQAVVNSASKQVQDIRKEAPKVNLSRGAASTSSNNVIAYASNFLGTPYVWGGTSPNPGFDCSGFVQYVYGHFGVSTGRTTYDQINHGAAVSRDQLQAGDLVFFGTSGNPTHVGIYLGNGAYIHAPQTGDVVKISPLNRRDYLTARRVN